MIYELIFHYITNTFAKNHQNMDFFDMVGKHLSVAKICDQLQLSSSFSLDDMTSCSQAGEDSVQYPDSGETANLNLDVGIFEWTI